MIDRKTIVETITLLKITYPSSLKDFKEAELKIMIDTWVEDFKNVSKEEFNKAIQKLRYTSSFFPSVADIKRVIAENKMESFPLAEDEWLNVLEAVTRYGSYRQEEAMKSLKPYTAKIVGYIGFLRICAADSQTQVWNRKEFISEYNALKDKVTIDLQLGFNEVPMLNG